MKITRKEVLKAIRTEKLRGGDFAHAKLISGLRTYDNDCAVCAVGGVLRNRGISISEIGTRAWDLIGRNNSVNSSGNEFAALRNKNYLQALSIKFEKLCDRQGRVMPGTRKTLAYFVKRHFPKTFKTVGSLE